MRSARPTLAAAADASHRISSFRLYRLEMPCGRRTGDHAGWFESMDIVALRLETKEGNRGWGFGQTISRGNFTRAAPYMVTMPTLAWMRDDFVRTVWPRLDGANPVAPIIERPRLFRGQGAIQKAIRIALWDLTAQSAGLPLHGLLAARPQRDRIRAYGSGLDFPLSDEDAVALYRRFVDAGFRAIKVKVGHPDPWRDVRRLRFIREAVGEDVEIAIDANEAWTCDEAIARIRLFADQGVRLSYVEDPLGRHDVKGMRRLNASIDIDVVGHDYVVDPRHLRWLAERKALSRLRVHADVDFALACADIAADHSVPLISGNSPFELGVHAAVAMPSFERLEFADLGWNRLPKTPIRFEEGHAIAPSTPGIGLEPHPDMLKQFSRPG
jgi:L-alanine-DL-glutamate epimerase-like enolase superfamily enzyme